MRARARLESDRCVTHTHCRQLPRPGTALGERGRVSTLAASDVRFRGGDEQRCRMRAVHGHVASHRVQERRGQMSCVWSGRARRRPVVAAYGGGPLVLDRRLLFSM